MEWSLLGEQIRWFDDFRLASRLGFNFMTVFLVLFAGVIVEIPSEVSILKITTFDLNHPSDLRVKPEVPLLT